MIGFISAILIAAAAPVLNPTFSPDSSKVAFTRGGDLYVADLASKDTLRLTADGSDVVMNGYASWVYYEEIFGRQSNYRAFWWSPDSKKIAYYRFDDSSVGMFPIFSPFGKYGSVRQTRYPKAGERNPYVEVHIVDLPSMKEVVPFSGEEDVYYGTPFWGDDSKELYVSKMPRRQSQLDLYAASSDDGSLRSVYHEEYPTWINWIEDMLFTDKGLYMVRDFQSGWQQIYFLGFDGTLKCLTEGQNWDVRLLRLDRARKQLWFVAKRDSRIHPTLYRLDLRKGRITAMTDPSQWASKVVVNDDGSFSADCSVSGAQVVCICNEGFDLYGLISYPEGFDPSKKYPVVMQLYGGPGTPYVRDRKGDRDATDKWCAENGIIYIVVDPRSSGENGRRGMDEAFRRMTVIELQDYLAWARYLQGLPYVDGAHIGVEGFSFGGTTTAMLVLRYPEYFRCGIAGGGVYDWNLYDTHYTERFMCTPSENPEGYDEACVLHFVSNDLVSPDYRPFSLMLTHGTGDDNVHFQNTLQLADALQRKGLQFELMIYPDGMHGYRGAQHLHDMDCAHNFWLKNLF